ncbi:hypothetical protein N7490_001713 [Penicillium lividum]|nr:hypothetical protein N7490_001713 [Penicillium lividum]
MDDDLLAATVIALEPSLSARVLPRPQRLPQAYGKRFVEVVFLSSLSVYRIVADAGDCAWANQAIAQCADVLLFSFSTGSRSATVHANLRKQNNEWKNSRSTSFDPCFVGEEVEVGVTFPKIRFSIPWHRRVPDAMNSWSTNF